MLSTECVSWRRQGFVHVHECLPVQSRRVVPLRRLLPKDTREAGGRSGEAVPSWRRRTRNGCCELSRRQRSLLCSRPAVQSTRNGQRQCAGLEKNRLAGPQSGAHAGQRSHRRVRSGHPRGRLQPEQSVPGGERVHERPVLSDGGETLPQRPSSAQRAEDMPRRG